MGESRVNIIDEKKCNSKVMTGVDEEKKPPSKIKEEAASVTEERENDCRGAIEEVCSGNSTMTPVCEVCGEEWKYNLLSLSMCVSCTGKLWRGDITISDNEFDRYDKINFINA